MECCSSTSSLDYEEDLENVCAILAANTVTVRRRVWVHDINMKRKEKGEFHHLNLKNIQIAMRCTLE